MLKGKRIMIDAGHGGSDPGRVGCKVNGKNVLEKDVALSVSFKLKRLLEAAGAVVFMTRDTDEKMAPSERLRRANSRLTDALVSIHLNGVTNGTVGGIETFYDPASPSSQTLARCIQRNLVESLELKDRGIKIQDLYMIRSSTNRTDVLTELCFLSNQKEAELAATEEFQNKAAEAICRGLDEFFLLPAA